MCKHCAGAARRLGHSRCLTTSTYSKVLNNDQVAALVAELKHEKDASLADMVLISVDTGTRLAEVAALKWADVNFEDKTITIFGKVGHRTALLSESLSTHLMRLRDNKPDSDVVFGQSCHALLCKLRHALRRACQKLGITPVNFHSFRLTFLSNQRDNEGQK